jgi:hypothetical protein
MLCTPCFAQTLNQATENLACETDACQEARSLTSAVRCQLQLSITQPFHLDQVTVSADNFRVEELPAHYSGDVV